jgi:hypothetical protein
MVKPVLDPAPSGKPHDWQYSKIQQMKGIVGLTFPPTWKNPVAEKTAPRDQDFRGTCVGQSTAHYFDIVYMTLLNKTPSKEDMAQFKKNVVDSLGTTHDILYYPSASAECAYQMSRFFGNVTYPAGSEIRFAVRAWKEYGMVREDQWHTDKKGTFVWMYPPGPRETTDGGVSPETAIVEAEKHHINGYAMCGTPDGGATWDEICYSIYTKGAVLGAIPVYQNYVEMQGGDGTFPDPGGEIDGFHALCFYGYDEDYLYFLNSWGDWCGRFGKLSKNYFNYSSDQSVWMVAIDKTEVEFGKLSSKTITIDCNVIAQVTVNGVVVGYTPQRISVEPGKPYTVVISADGYVSQTKTVDDSTTAISVVLEAVIVPQLIKGWLQILVDFWKYLIALFRK